MVKIPFAYLMFITPFAPPIALSDLEEHGRSVFYGDNGACRPLIPPRSAGQFSCCFACSDGTPTNPGPKLGDPLTQIELIGYTCGRLIWIAAKYDF